METVQRMHLFFASIQEGVVVANPAGKIVYFNPTASVLSSRLLPEVMGKDITEILPLRCEKPQAVSFWLQSLEGESAVAVDEDCSLVRLSGEEVPIAGVATPLYSEDGNLEGIVFVFRDTSDEKMLKSRQYEFLSFAAHQLRTPAAQLRWGFELIMREKERFSPPAQEILEDLRRGTMRLIDLINTLLDVSRVQEGRLVLAPEIKEVGDLIRASIAPLDQLAASLNVRLRVLDPSAPKYRIKIKVDPRRFRDVLQNLLTNAIRYNRPQGSVVVEAKTLDANTLMERARTTIFTRRVAEFIEQDQAAQRGRQYVLISVTDTGVGIPEEDQPSIFTNFFRSKNVVKMQTDGTGIGLFFAKSVVERSGGVIFFSSVEGKGTTFSFVFPAEN